MVGVAGGQTDVAAAPAIDWRGRRRSLVYRSRSPQIGAWSRAGDQRRESSRNQKHLHWSPPTFTQSELIYALCGPECVINWSHGMTIQPGGRVGNATGTASPNWVMSR